MTKAKAPEPAQADLIATIAKAGLANRASADVIAGELAALDAELKRLRDAHSAADVHAVNPLVAFADAEAARSEAQRLAHDIRRAEHLAGELRRRLAAARMAEAETEKRAKYDAAMAERDELANTLAEHYQPLVDELAAMLKRVADQGKLIAEVNAALPKGAELLRGAEFEARALAGVQCNGHPAIAERTMLVSLGCGSAQIVFHGRPSLVDMTQGMKKVGRLYEVTNHGIGRRIVNGLVQGHHAQVLIGPGETRVVEMAEAETRNLPSGEVEARELSDEEAVALIDEANAKAEAAAVAFAASAAPARSYHVINPHRAPALAFHAGGRTEVFAGSPQRLAMTPNQVDVAREVGLQLTEAA